MEQGDVEKTIIEQCVRQRRPYPDKIANAPTLLPGVEFYFEAFMDLTSERQIGFGISPIPWRAMIAWAEYNDFDFEDTEDLLYVLTRADRKFIEYMNKKNKPKKKGKKIGAKNG